MRRPPLLLVLVTVLAALAALAALTGLAGCRGDDTSDDAGVGSSAPTLSVPATADGGATSTTGTTGTTGGPPTTSEGGVGTIGPTSATASGGQLQPGLIDVSAITTCAELAESIVPLFDEMGARSESLAAAGRDEELMARLSATVGAIQTKQTELGCDRDAMTRATCAALATSDSPLAKEYVSGSC